jgi:hypothetical protein
MKSLTRVFEHFLSFKRVPLKVVLFTALASYILQLGMILQGQPLYIIALFTLLPWVPVLMFEGLWKLEHYHWIAIFAAVAILQIGHFAEHVVQVGALSFAEGTAACPPPIDSGLNFQRAFDAGLLGPNAAPSNYSAAIIVQPDGAGMPILNPDGTQVSGPPACGIFGQLDIEVVHLVWELIGWILALVLLQQYPRNWLLWFSVFWLTIHTFEHLYISYFFFIDKEAVYQGSRQLWATVANGNIVTAIPFGKEPALVAFYDVAGKFGIVAKGGLLGALIPSLNESLPARPFLHFWYNALSILPLVAAFVWEVRKVFDQYLAKALPNLNREQLVQATLKLAPGRFTDKEIIVKQGDVADAFYIISRGEVEVVLTEANGDERLLSTLTEGQYFGEIGLMQGGTRVATVRAKGEVEVLRLDRDTFGSLMDNSEMSRQDMERMVKQRMDRNASTAGD